MRKKIAGLALGAVLLALSLPAEAQRSKKIPRIGWLSPFAGSSSDASAREGDKGPNVMAFMEGLRERGYIERQNIIIEYRFSAGREDQLSESAAELVRLKVDVIVAETDAATSAAKQATTTTPIVFVYSDPVSRGLVPNLAKPGGNLTGLSFFSSPLAGKRLEVLKQAFPKISRVGILMNIEAPDHRAQFAEMHGMAERLGVQLESLGFRYSKQDFESIFQQAVSQRANGLLALQGWTISLHRSRILDLAAKSRLPAMYPTSRYTEAGGLMSYGASSVDLYRRAAYFVDKILKGAKPADLPVEQPTKFELVINLKTAKEIGVTIHPEVLMWADRVIE